MRDTHKTHRENCFVEVFQSHRWGNSANSGVDYVRPYNKTRRAKERQLNKE